MNTGSRPKIVGVPERQYELLPMAEDRAVGWDALRDIGPVVLMNGSYYLTRRDDVLQALRDPVLFSSKRAFDMLGSPLPLVPLAYDPPEHTRIRRILQPFFAPNVLAQILPSLQQQAIAIVDGVTAHGRCEAVADIAIPYPSQVFLTLFGLPLEDRDRLISWKNAIIAMADRPDLEGADLTSALELFGYLTEAIVGKRADPSDDILSALLTGEDALDDAEAIGLCYLFVLAGLDTVTSAIASALLALARDPQLRQRLIAEPEQTRVFVEEIIRLEPPAPVVPRVTAADVTIGGITLPEGTPVRLCIAAINRDEADEFSTDSMVIDGKIHRHWGFGGGPHRCLGSHLARLELSLIITEWLKRVPEFRVEDGFQPRIEFPAPTFTLARLPLVLGAS
ncbi:MAG: cytochrome P450 [Mycobacterium sp.]